MMQYVFSSYKELRDFVKNAYHSMDLTVEQVAKRYDLPVETVVAILNDNY